MLNNQYNLYCKCFLSATWVWPTGKFFQLIFTVATIENSYFS